MVRSVALEITLKISKKERLQGHQHPIEVVINIVERWIPVTVDKARSVIDLDNTSTSILYIYDQVVPKHLKIIIILTVRSQVELIKWGPRPNLSRLFSDLILEVRNFDLVNDN